MVVQREVQWQHTKWYHHFRKVLKDFQFSTNELFKLISFFLGLFHRAIAESGVNMAPWALPARKGFARQQTTKLAKIFDCYTPNDWARTLDCLRTIPSQNITATLEDFFVSVAFFAFFVEICIHIWLFMDLMFSLGFWHRSNGSI